MQVNTATASDRRPRWHDSTDAQADTMPSIPGPLVMPQAAHASSGRHVIAGEACTEIGAQPERRHIEGDAESFVRGVFVGLIGGLAVWAVAAYAVIRWLAL